MYIIPRLFKSLLFLKSHELKVFCPRTEKGQTEVLKEKKELVSLTLKKELYCLSVKLKLTKGNS